MVEYKQLHTLEDHDPIFQACQNGDVSAVRSYLKAGGSSLAGSENKPHLASYALTAGQVAVVALMLDHDLKVNAPINRRADTALDYAVSGGQLAIVELLLARGADVNHRHDESGHCSAFVRACGGPHLEIVKLLLAAGGNVHDRRDLGVTPMMEAARNGKFANMELLYAAGAKVDEADQDGATPLIIAGKRGMADVARWLLNRGADPNTRDEDGKTALDWARANNRTETVQLLERYSAK